MLRHPHPVDIRRLVWTLCAVFIVRPWVRFAYRCRVQRPAAGLRRHAIFVANHRSFFDPILVGCMADRPVAFFARANLWKIPIIGLALRTFGGFPIDRDEPQLEIMKRTVAELKAGRSILVFPEGTRTRSGGLGKLRDGLALFARRSGVPVVPLYLDRTESVWPRGWPLPLCIGRLGFHIGPVLEPPAELHGRKRDAWLMQAVTDWMHVQETRCRSGSA